MGLKDLRSWNNGLLAKTLWSIHKKKDTLWIKWINEVFLRGRHMEPKGFQKMTRLIQKILSLRDEMLDHGSMDELIAMLCGSFGSKNGM